MLKLLRENKSTELMPIFLSYFFMTFGNRIGQFGILFYLWFSIKDASIIGVILLIQMLGKASSGFLFNILNHWISHSTLFSTNFIIRIINYLLFVVYFNSSSNNIFVLSLLLVIHSLVESFIEPVIYSTISYKISEKNFTKYNSLVSLIDNLSLFISPAIGSILIVSTNNSISPLLLIVTFLIFLGYTFIHKKGIFPELEKKKKKVPIKEGLKILLHNKTILYLLVTFMVFNLIMFPLLSIIFPAYIIVENNLGSSYIAYFEILFSTGLILTSTLQMITPSSLYKSKLMIVLAFVLGGIGLLWLSVVPWVILAGLGCFIIGVCLSILRVNNTAFMQQSIDKNIQSDFFAIRSSLLLSVSPVSAAVVSFAIDLYSSKIVMFVGSIILFIMALSLYPVLLNNKQEKNLNA